MNYQKIYESLIDRARNRIPEGYVERHHITPECMGGTDEKENLVALYPEEHLLAHILLVKIYPDHNSLIAAVSMMCADGRKKRWKGKRRRKLYGWLKKQHSEYMSANQSGSGNSQYGTRWICNLETKENKKISKRNEIPEGWVAGRNVWNLQPKRIRPKKKQIVKPRVERPVKFQPFEAICYRCSVEFTQKTKIGRACPGCRNKVQSEKKISCGGTIFLSLTDAAKTYGVSVEAIRQRLNSKTERFISWIYLES